jgi:hypothetical protein
MISVRHVKRERRIRRIVVPLAVVGLMAGTSVAVGYALAGGGNASGLLDTAAPAASPMVWKATVTPAMPSPAVTTGRLEISLTGVGVTDTSAHKITNGDIGTFTLDTAATPLYPSETIAYGFVLTNTGTAKATIASQLFYTVADATVPMIIRWAVSSTPIAGVPAAGSTPYPATVGDPTYPAYRVGGCPTIAAAGTAGTGYTVGNITNPTLNTSAYLIPGMTLDVGQSAVVCVTYGLSIPGAPSGVPTPAYVRHTAPALGNYGPSGSPSAKATLPAYLGHATGSIAIQVVAQSFDSGVRP